MNKKARLPIPVLIARPKIFLIFLSFFLLSASNSLYAQKGRVAGVVKDATGNAIESVSVMVKGNSTGTTTDANGHYSIEVPNQKAILVFSYTGYISKEERVGSMSSINITLAPGVNNLDEVVVVGYGTSRKKDLTGSVSSVKIAGQEKTPVIGTSQLLEGKVSGVQVTQNQSQPGGTVFSIRIRGTNSITSSSEPLYVVDGYAGADVSSIDPSDIASIEVLKDASAAAIYGSRGANGVILITTKRGRGHGVTLDAYTGVQKVSKQYNMMNAKQFGTYLNNVQQQLNDLNNTSQALPYTQSQIDAMGAGTNWQNAIFRTTPISR